MPVRSALFDEGSDAFGRVARHHVLNHDLRGVPVGVGKAHLALAVERLLTGSHRESGFGRNAAGEGERFRALGARHDHLVDEADAVRVTISAVSSISIACLEATQTVMIKGQPNPKDPGDWRLIGKHVPKVDTVSKTNGSAMFTIDVKLPDLATCLIARPSRFGAKPKDVDPAPALAVPGVKDDSAAHTTAAPRDTI